MNHHCQICEREIKALHGLIAHHGYTRRYGEQTKSCEGAREEPYEVSNLKIPDVVNRIRHFITGNENIIKRVEEEHIPVPPRRNYCNYNKKSIEYGDTNYSYRSQEWIAQLRSEMKMAQKDIDRLDKRFNEWKRIE